jgi:2-oxoglutarate decarboxylase
VDPNVFETANAGFAQVLYEDYLRDPASVPDDWRRLFESGVVGEQPPPPPTIRTDDASTEPAKAGPAPAPAAIPTDTTLIKGPAARLVANMAESLTVPTATSFRELSVGRLDSRRRQINQVLAAAGRNFKVSFTHLIGFALIEAPIRRQFPKHEVKSAPR